MPCWSNILFYYLIMGSQWDSNLFFGYIAQMKTQISVRPFQRHPNSQKHYPHRHKHPDEYFDLSLADMDVGVCLDIHSGIMEIYEQTLDRIGQHSGLQRGIAAEKERKELQQRARSLIVKWYMKVKNITLGSSCSYGLFTSVVTYLSYCILALSEPQDQVLVFSPVYASYYSLIKATGRQCLAVQLSTKNCSSNELDFQIDWANLAEQIPRAKIVVICNPHNPSGRAWQLAELQQLLGLCRKHNVTILSDEILSDIRVGGGEFVSMASLRGGYSKVVIMHSIGKSFNFSSAQMGYSIIVDGQIGKSINQVCDLYKQRVSLFALCCMQGCLTDQGQAWLSYINQIVTNNYNSLRRAVSGKMAGVRVARLAVGHLVYLELGSYYKSAQQMMGSLQAAGISVLSLQSNYVTPNDLRVEARICIACSEEKFAGFLRRLQRCLNQAQPPKNARPRL